MNGSLPGVFLRSWGKKNRHKAPVKAGIFVKHGDLAAGFRKAVEQILADACMCHLTAAETYCDFYAVPFFQEFCAFFSLTLKSLTSMTR